MAATMPSWWCRGSRIGSDDPGAAREGVEHRRGMHRVPKAVRGSRGQHTLNALTIRNLFADIRMRMHGDLFHSWAFEG